MKVVDAVVDDLRTDVTWNRVGRLGAKGAKAFPQAAVQYAVDKVPIVGWLPRYNPRWILNDIIAGLTLGLMLIPQGLSYAKLASIPVQYGLMSSWLPSAIYAVMGTTKDLSTGPTSLIGLLTSQAVAQLTKNGEYTPQEVASAVAMMMGVYGMALGFLKLGFLLEFVSIPILTGFISAVAITIALNQMASLLGESGVASSGTAPQIHDVFAKLPKASGLTCAVGFTGILFLTILDQAGKRWGQKNRLIWGLSITRAFLCLILYTGVSYAVNRGRNPDDYLFDVVEVKSNGQEPPTMPRTDLLSKVASHSIAVFIGAAIEHTSIGRAFGVKNSYVPDFSQELCYFGITNFFNSFFKAMGVGGAMSRTSVNSSCNVKSPLSGLITTAVVLVCIFRLMSTLYWIPKATLAAIIICAVWPLIYPPSAFYRFWKVSLADFISSMLAFWIALFVSTEYGIFVPVAFNIAYCLVRQIFVRVSSTGNGPLRSELAAALDEARSMPSEIPADAHIFRFNDSFFFCNSYSVTTKILDSVRTYHAPSYRGNYGTEAERNWSVVAEKRLARLRKRAGIYDASTLPAIGLVILDFSKVNHIDYTAVTHMQNMVDELRKYGGDHVELRFVAMSAYVRERFNRAGWNVVDGAEATRDEDETWIRAYRTVGQAVAAPRAISVDDEGDLEKMDTANKVTAAHQETV